MFGRLRKRNRNPKEVERRFKANDSEFNGQFQYADNYISTSKYNLVTFLPKNLFEQFQRMANAYFLFLLVLQLIPEVSSLTPLTTAVPLATVLLISAVKDAIDDFQRRRSDNQVNNRTSWLLRDGKLTQVKWRQVAVGDIVKMENNQFVTADVLLLSTSEPNGLCYIETAALDGETNLKVRQALPATEQMANSVELLSAFNGEVLCEPPNDVLSKFQGRLSWEGETYSLDNDKILLRGCRLRNTEWCFGLVVFAGKDTKLMMNSGETKFKRTHIDRLMNLLIIGIFIFLLTMCLLCAICCAVWEVLVGGKFQVYLPWESFVPGREKENGKGAGAVVIATLVFFSYIIVLNTVVPISLYVSVEMIRFGHSWWINWDKEMYDSSTDTPAKSRTTTLNEELGQIEYIFSDKTGTLTKNVMTFNKCSVGGRSYGDPLDDHGIPHDVTEKTPTVDFSENPFSESAFHFYDNCLWHMAVKGDEGVHQFFRLLALCHTVMAEEKDGKLIYQAQSPDEGALVTAARNFGFVFKSRTPSTITIEVFGKEEVHELLSILDFNNVRKRMSVVLRRNDRIWLYCKGADSTIFQRLHPDCSELKEVTSSHLNDFAQDGLRTLCCAVKEIEPNFYEAWKRRHHEATTSTKNRDQLLDDVCEEIEKDLMLIGASAIEDQLQDGVPETIANLAMAGIKIWVLTGDKQETAINIGYSSRLLTENMEDVFLVDGEDFEEVEKQMTNAKEEMEARRKEDQKQMEDRSNILPQIEISPIESCGNSEFALVINGASLVHALTERLESLLVEVGCQCQAVICCRVTPLQKALVVELIKRQKKSATLAIGDGANDVSMIRAAHIGVGISGQEGMQAVLASDFSFTQFRFLERLLLVHGRWSYLRMAKFLRYFFYKNFAFTLCHFWFAFFCGFSAQTIFDEAFISLYNLCYTSLPVIAMAIFDQDVADRCSRLYPRLYIPGQRNLFFNKKVFGRSVAEGIVTSLILFFIPYFTFKDCVNSNGLDISGHRALGFVIASILIVVVTFRCALETAHWTGFNHFVTWGSIVFYFVFILIFYSEPFGYSYEGVATTLMASAPFWFSLILCVIVLLVPVIVETFYRRMTRPTLTDKVRLMQKRSKTAVTAKDRIIRRASSSRRSQRSVRHSGYAFAHQSGYGELITSGSMMHLPKTPSGEPSVCRAVTSVGVLTTLALFRQQIKDNSPRDASDNIAYEDGEAEREEQPATLASDLDYRPMTAKDLSLNERRLKSTDSDVTEQTGSNDQLSDIRNSRQVSTASHGTETEESNWEKERRRGGRQTVTSHSPVLLELRQRSCS